jgi:hypothetical protein
MNDFFAKVLGEIVFRILLLLIDRLGTKAYIDDVMAAIEDRLERAGLWAALKSAADGVVQSVHSRTLPLRELVQLEDNLIAPYAFYCLGFNIIVSLALALDHSVAQSLLQHHVIWAAAIAIRASIFVLAILIPSYVLRYVCVQVTDVESTVLHVVLLTCASLALLGFCMDQYFASGRSPHVAVALATLLTIRSVLGLALAWIFALHEAYQADRLRRRTRPSYYR